MKKGVSMMRLLWKAKKFPFTPLRQTLDHHSMQLTRTWRANRLHETTCPKKNVCCIWITYALKTDMTKANLVMYTLNIAVSPVWWFVLFNMNIGETKGWGIRQAEQMTHSVSYSWNTVWQNKVCRLSPFASFTFFPWMPHVCLWVFLLVVVVLAWGE